MYPKRESSRRISFFIVFSNDDGLRRDLKWSQPNINLSRNTKGIVMQKLEVVVKFEFQL